MLSTCSCPTKTQRPVFTANSAEAQRYDPTMTTTLRRQFEGALAKRFRKLKGAINTLLITDDAFGLRTNRTDFRFLRSGDKVAAFQEWLKEQQDAGILELTPGVPAARAAETSWASVYVRSAYHKGMSRSASQLRKEGVSVAPSWVVDAFTRPFHVDRVGLAYTRVFQELEGITAEMDRQISRTLAQGLSQGTGAVQLAKELNDRVDKIGITRARMMARTEVIRAHAEASLNTYEEAGILGVGIEAEWRTAQDDSVCQECDDAASGGPYNLADARGMIPLHPNCRCAWVPQVVDPTAVRLS